MHSWLLWKKSGSLTKEVEVLNEIPLGASLVRGTKDVDEETLGQETAGNTISVDIRLLHAAGNVATTALGLGLVDGQGTVGRRAVRLSSNAEGEGEGSGNNGELHCDFLTKVFAKMQKEVLYNERVKRKKDFQRRFSCFVDG